jgi:hypothetical protein
MRFREDIKIGSNVRLRLLDKPGGDVVEQRESHNIFTDYGREWISELSAYDASLVPFRGDRIRWVGVGIGGDSQSLTYTAVQALGYGGFADDWQYGGYPGSEDLTRGGEGGTGGVGPSQNDTTPSVTGLEYPVQMTSQNYYDEVKQPASFPEAGIVRFTAVLGYTDVSYGSYASVPMSEIGLFTGSATEGVTDRQMPPLDSAKSRGPYPPATTDYYPPVGTRFMVAYNTFPTLTKTSAFVLQVDWELRFS